MVRGEGQVNKVHYKGKEDDFIVMVEDVAEYNKWKGDKSIPLVEVVSGFKIFVTHKHGAQGTLDTASNASLENEFGTSNEDECMKKILEGGSLQQTENAARGRDTNDSKGTRQAH